MFLYELVWIPLLLDFFYFRDRWRELLLHEVHTNAIAFLTLWIGPEYLNEFGCGLDVVDDGVYESCMGNEVPMLTV